MPMTTQDHADDHRLDAVATLSDVNALYLVVMGRQAEDAAVAMTHAGRPIGALLQTFLQADEFSNLVETTRDGGDLPHDRLGRADHAVAVRWLSRFAGARLPAGTMNWWLVLDTLFRLDEVAALCRQIGLGAFVQEVSKRAGKQGAYVQALRPYLRFDADWFLRQDSRAGLAIGRDGDSVALRQRIAAYFMSEGLDRDVQLLPAFSNGMRGVAERLTHTDDVGLQDIVEEIATAARSQAATHWLFHADFYRDQVRQRGTLRWSGKRLSADVPYLDFLANEASGVDDSPHPLFCFHAYRTMNTDLAGGRDTPFLHFLTEGWRSNLATSAIFDANYYLASNPKAKYAILTGTHRSALQHFLVQGIYEDLTFSPDFDLGFYIGQNGDVRSALENRAIPSATWHFVFQGLREERQPNPYFNARYYRERHPGVDEEMRRLGIGSALEHFLLIGRSQGYKPERPLAATTPPMDAAKAIFLRRSRRSYNNVLRRPLDFSRFSADVRLSVIVPIFNEVEFTCRFLECAYFAAAVFQAETGMGCEIVLVDNGSRDDTARVLAACPGLVVSTFPDPIGFPRAVNAGVAASAGEVVVVANNDIEFPADTFAKLWRRLDADPAIGMVGGLTILPNETLQEAGSFLDAGANVIGLGRGENPWDSYFQGVHRADYCTGCFIGLRRADLEAVGGLDEAFSPGYYEETDLSFRMAGTLGKTAVVDAELQITHFEHASFGKGRPPTTAYALIKRNQARFAEKHRERIARLPGHRQLMSPNGARPGAIGRTRLLVIEDMIPDARLGSGFVRSAQLLDGLTRHGVAFDLLALNPNRIVDDFADPRVTVYRAWIAGEDAETVLSRADRYSHVMICRTHNLGRFADRLNDLQARFGFRILCDTEALSSFRALEGRRLAGAVIGAEERTAAVRLELDTPARVDHWIAVSSHERQQMARAGFPATTVIAMNVGVRPGDARAWSQRDRILAVGAIHEAGVPNHDALIWFMDNVWPQCAEPVHALRLTVAGLWRPDVRRSFEERYAGRGVEFVGVVDDATLSRLYAESRMAIAPTRIAAGVATKVLEPMMKGLPIVVTDLLEEQLVGEGPMGASGMAVGSRFDGGASFARWMQTLATDAEAWERVRARQLEIAEPLGSMRAFDEGIRELLRAVDIPDR